MINSILNIAWLTWHPNHYNDYLFSEVSKQKWINLNVYYLKSVIKKYPWSGQRKKSFNYYFAYSHKLPWIKYFIDIISKDTDIVIVAGWNNINHILSLLFLGFSGRKFIIWSDTPKLNYERSGLKNYLRKKYLDFVIKKASYVFTTGNPGIQSFKKMGISEDKLLNFPFVTDTEFFKPLLKKPGKTNFDLILLCSGRLDINHKGQDLSIKAVKHLVNNGIHVNLKIAGTGPDEDFLREMCEDLDIKENVDFLGWLEYPDLLKFYNSGDILIHTSHTDPFPNAVLEAMACGLPIIGSELAGSVLDRVRNGYNGFIHKDNSVESIVKHINKLVQNPELIKKFGQNARNTALENSVRNNLSTIERLKNEFFDSN